MLINDVDIMRTKVKTQENLKLKDIQNPIKKVDQIYFFVLFSNCSIDSKRHTTFNIHSFIRRVVNVGN